MIDRMEYLQSQVFANFENDSYLENYFLEKGYPISSINERKNQVFDILRQWGNYEIEFSNAMMEKYSPRYKGRTSPFKNIGITPQLESMHSKKQKYFGLSQGKTYREFLADATNPKNIIHNPLKKNHRLLVLI